MSIAGLTSIGVSGLDAAQFGLTTTGNNIANSGTAGYNRETVGYQEGVGSFAGVGYLGTGVQVSGVNRVYSQFLAAQVNQSQTQYSQLNTYYQQVQQIDNMLGSPTAGLSSSLSNLFAQLQTASSAPGDAATRQTVLGAAQSLATTFQSLSGSLSQLSTSVNGQIGDDVTQVNSYAKQIASLNQAILTAQTSANGAAPNALLDQRDQAVASLNQLVQANVVKASDGSYNVFIGTGQTLVMGQQNFSLKAVPSASDPTQTTIGYQGPSGTTVAVPEGSIAGGALAGLLSFRAQTLNPTQNALGAMALTLADSFNGQNQLGIDLNGQPGGNIFSVAPPTVLANAANSATGGVSATVANAAQLTTSDYTLAYDGTNYTLTRTSDGTTWSGTSLPLKNTNGTYPDGLQLSVTNPLAAGDKFTILPTRDAASSLAVTMTDPSKLALAGAVATAKGSANTGSGAIDAGSVDATYLAAPLSSPVTLTYNGGPPSTLSFSPAGAAVTATVNGTATTYAAGTPVPYTPGTPTQLSFGGITVNLSGAPANGDTFTVSPNTSGVSDSRNGQLLSALQTAKTMAGGTASFTDVYAKLVSDIGSTTSQYQTTSTAQSNLLKQATNAQSSVSGVNMDEEAANLLNYQQMYQANSKVIQIASTLFDTILNLNP